MSRSLNLCFRLDASQISSISVFCYISLLILIMPNKYLRERESTFWSIYTHIFCVGTSVLWGGQGDNERFFLKLKINFLILKLKFSKNTKISIILHPHTVARAENERILIFLSRRWWWQQHTEPASIGRKDADLFMCFWNFCVIVITEIYYYCTLSISRLSSYRLSTLILVLTAEKERKAFVYRVFDIGGKLDSTRDSRGVEITLTFCICLPLTPTHSRSNLMAIIKYKWAKKKKKFKIEKS